MSALYLVSDGDRAAWLAAEKDGRVYCYVPNLKTFVYNQPLSLDFLIDHDLTYEPTEQGTAARIIKHGALGKIDARSNKDLLEDFRAETRRLNPCDVLAANTFRADPEPTSTDIANAKAALVSKTAPGRWLVYKTYPTPDNHKAALRMACDLRKGRVRAFGALKVQARVVTSENGQQIVQITRMPPDAC